MKTYHIVTTNEGQELNYTHIFKGTLATAKHKAGYITATLQGVLTQGTIGCSIQDLSGKELAFLSASNVWEKRP